MGEYASQDRHDYHQALVDLVPPRARVLDVGSGRGGLAQRLRDELQCDVRCVDASDEAVARCRDKGLTVQQLDIGVGVDAIPGKYDVVVLCSSLDSMLDPVTVLSRFHQKIDTGGRLLIWTPNSSFIYSRLAYVKGLAPKCIGYSSRARVLGVRGYDDVQFFTKASLGCLLAETGYTDLEWHFECQKPREGSHLVHSLMFYLLRAFAGREHADLFSGYLCVLARSAGSFQMQSHPRGN